MDEDSIVRFLERIGCDKIKVRGSEVVCSCVFPENHRRGDQRPSFYVRINDSGYSPFFCHACHAKGTIEYLAKDRGFDEFLSDGDCLRPKEQRWFCGTSINAGLFSSPTKKKPRLFRDDYLKPFIGVLSGYLRRRGITLDTAREWELGVDRRHKRAIFPVRDYKGRLALLIGRDVTGKSEIKYSNYVLDTVNGKMVPFIDHKRREDFKSPTKSFFLYGEVFSWSVLNSDNIDSRKKDLIVVEGVMDVLRLWQNGRNAIAVLGSYPSDTQIDKIVMFVPRGGRLIVMPDGDDAGRLLLRQMKEKIGRRLQVFGSILPDGMDPCDLSDDEIEGAMRDVIDA